MFYYVIQSQRVAATVIITPEKKKEQNHFDIASAKTGANTKKTDPNSCHCEGHEIFKSYPTPIVHITPSFFMLRVYRLNELWGVASPFFRVLTPC